MDFNYSKIKFGNWLYKNCFPAYNLLYTRFKLKNDRDEIALLRQLIKPGHRVLDIGANIGFYARLLSNTVGKTGQVYCFEPDSLNFKHLVKNTKNLDNVHVFNLAVSDKDEVLKVYKSKLLNVDHRTYPVNNYDSVEEIEASSIDNLIAAKRIEPPDVIKIDIQGFELVAFQGMRKLLTTRQHLKIVAEYWPHGFKRAGTSAIEFYDFFAALGFGFLKIEGTSTTPLARSFVVEHNDEAFEFSFNVLIQKI